MAATNKRGIFALLDVRERQGAGVWSLNTEVFLDSDTARSHDVVGWNFGYWVGGSGGTAFRRLDFTNETFSDRQYLTTSASSAGSSASATKGYFYQQGTAGVISYIFANDTETYKQPGAYFGQYENYTASTYNTNYAYSRAAYNLYRFDFANETFTKLNSSNLNGQEAAAAGNQSYGYFGGGMPAGSTVERLDYSNDSAALAPKGPLSRSGGIAGATGNANYGWWQGGGLNSSSWASHSTLVDRIDYSNDTATASPRGNLAYSAGMQPSDIACGNSTHSYLAGYHPGSPQTQKIDYDNDTVTCSSFTPGSVTIFTASASNVQYGLPIVPLQVSGLGPKPYGSNGGYFAGGHNPSDGYKSTMDRIDYTNDTATASPKGSLSVGRQAVSGTSNPTTAYFGGGGNPALAIYSIVDRVDYFNDTVTATPKGPLVQQKHFHASAGNINFGYFSSGLNHLGSITSSTSRVDYANDNITATPKGVLSSSKKELAATGNQDFGYFAGGSPGSVTTVNRLQYSSDTSNMVTKGPLNTGRRIFAATGNSDSGYFMGGPGLSSVERLTFANDTVALTVKGPLSSNYSGFGATGTQNFGYAGGSVPAQSKVDRIDYSNDTATASPKGPLSAGRAYSGAASPYSSGLKNQGTPCPVSINMGTNVSTLVNYGYVFCNNPFGVMRHNYSNDNFSLTPTVGPSPGHNRGAAASSPSHGYFAFSDNGNQMSSISRIDFAADDVQRVYRGNTGYGGYDVGHSYNTSYAWFSGGSPSISSYVTRLDYSNDLNVTSPKGNLSREAREHSSTGTQNFGYHTGGGPAPSGSRSSTVDRIDYSNDTATATPKGPLSYARSYHGASSNADFGYFMGGYDSNGAVNSIVDRIDFANDTGTALQRTFMRNGYYLAGYGNHGTAYVTGNVSNTTRVQRMDFSNENFTMMNTPFYYIQQGKALSARQNGADVPTQNLSTYPISTIQTYPGPSATYFAGGNPYPGYGTPVQKYNSINDTMTKVSDMNIGRAHFSTFGNRDFGYMTGYAVSYLDRLDYSNDTAPILKRGFLSMVPSANDSGAGNLNFGYNAFGYKTNVDRIDYSNDTATASPKGKMLHARTAAHAAFGGNQSFGYWAGGQTPSSGGQGITNIDRLDYSNDTANALSKGSFILWRYNMGVSSNASFGYWAGGQRSGGGSSWIERVDYSNDTATALLKGAFRFSNGGNYTSGTGDGAFGYFKSNFSSIDRMDYANDANGTVIKASTPPLGPSAAQVGAFSAMENGLIANLFPSTSQSATNFAYFQGGTNGTFKIDYSNDTAIVPSGTYNPSWGGMGAVAQSNSNYGYVAGGPGPTPGSPTPSPYGCMRRLDYSNDVYGIEFKGALYTGMYGSPGPGASTGNSNYGYWGGSWNLSGPLAPSPIDGSSKVNRLDYSNDATQCVNRGDLAVGTNSLSGTGNLSYGYWIGGSGTGAPSTVQRLDYSNDNVTLSPKGPLTLGRYNHGSVGNANYGYVAAGQAPSGSPGQQSSTERIDYSSDTSTASPKGPLANANPSSNGLHATGNNSFGYFVYPNRTFVNRVDYSNDTATASSRGNLSTNSPSYGDKGFSAAQNGLPN